MADLEWINDYVKSEGYTSSMPLPGGTANFVWRIHSIEDPSQTAVLKHAEPFVALAPSIPFSLERMDYEHLALVLLQPLSTSEVAIPEVKAYQADKHCIIMSDGGSSELKAMYGSLSHERRHRFGTSLGGWLASLHTAHLAALDKSRFENPTGKSMSHFATYGRLAARAAARGPEDVAFFQMVATRFGASVLSDDELVCHGDFWPGNVLLQLSEDTREAGATSLAAKDRLTVVDWEMVRTGSGATDVGQFAAEAYLLGHFRGDGDFALLDEFLAAYCSVGARLVSKERVQKILVHFGVHFYVWLPRQQLWGPIDERNKVVMMGEEVIRKAVAEDWTWLRTCPIGAILSLLPQSELSNQHIS